MRISRSYLVVAVVVTAMGCQQQSNNESGGTPSTELSQSTRPESKSTEPPVPDSPLIADEAGAKSDDHEHQGSGMTGRGPGMGQGPGGMGGGPGAMGGMRKDMTTLRSMFDGRAKITRTVKNLPDGAEATTESDDEGIAALLKEHVPAMESRVTGNNPLPPMTFHPIFVELIKHADDYSLTYEETEKGMQVNYRTDDPYVVMLVQEHAKLVSRFIKNGMEEIHKPYTLPTLEVEKKVTPPTEE